MYGIIAEKLIIVRVHEEIVMREVHVRVRVGTVELLHQRNVHVVVIYHHRERDVLRSIENKLQLILLLVVVGMRRAVVVHIAPCAIPSVVRLKLRAVLAAADKEATREWQRISNGVAELIKVWNVIRNVVILAKDTYESPFTEAFGVINRFERRAALADLIRIENVAKHVVVG